MDFGISSPLLNLGHVVSYLHAFWPVAHIFSKENVIKSAGANIIEGFPEDSRDELRIKPVLLEDGVEPTQKVKQFVEGFRWVNVVLALHR